MCVRLFTILDLTALDCLQSMVAFGTSLEVRQYDKDKRERQCNVQFFSNEIVEESNNYCVHNYLFVAKGF